MKRRWIIRAFFIVLLLLFAGAWMRSYVYEETIGHNGGEHGRVFWESADGGRLIAFAGAGYLETRSGWWFHRYRYQENEISGGPDDLRFLGFRFGHGITPGFGLHWWLFEIPFWFLTALSALLLVFAWRKTRPTGKGHAFPVNIPQPITRQSQAE